jgi:archaellum component FlaC
MAGSWNVNAAQICFTNSVVERLSCAMEEDSVMDYPISNTIRVFPPLIFDVGNKGDHQMEQLTKRVEELEKTTQQIQMDVAVLTARSEHFATKADIEKVRAEQGVMRVEIMGELGALEQRLDKKFERMEDKFDKKFEKIDEKFGKIDEKFERIDEKFERIDEKFDRVDQRFNQLEDKISAFNNSITWKIMIPTGLLVLAWFVQNIVLKMS